MKKRSLLSPSSPSAGGGNRSRRRRCALTIRCIHRALVVSTGVLLMGLLWNAYRFGYDVKPLQQITAKNEKDTTIGDKLKELRDKRPLNHGPPEWKRDRFPPPSQSSGLHSLCHNFDHSIRRPQHGCQVNKDTRTVYCNFENLRIDTTKINMESRGGEVLSSVMGRDEGSEFPTYRKAAFSTPTKPKYEVPTEYRSNLHYLEGVLNSLRYPTAKNKGKLDLTCKKSYPGTTLFLTRYEYVNLFHTLTDWWNSFFVLPRTMHGKNNDDNELDDITLSGNEGIVKPDRVVFLDGHAQGILDTVWKSLFGDYHYIAHMGDDVDGGICFERAIFVPPGYKSPLFNDFQRTQCPHRGMAKAFSNFVLEQYNLLQEPKVVKGNIVVIDRQPFVAHPRSDPNNLARRFVTSELEKLKNRLQEIPSVKVRLVRLETLSFEEQLRLLRETQVLIGIHGAALSHILFMDESRSHAIEFQPTIQLDFFEYLSEWKGIDHKRIELDVSDSLTDLGIEETVRAVMQYQGV